MNLLHIGLFNDQEPQRALRHALRSVADSYKEYDWRQTKASFGKEGLNGLMLDSDADVVFMQIQCNGVIDIDTVRALKGRGVQIFNFTGDVRYPLPQWYKDIAPYVTTLFTNADDVDTLRDLGYHAEYFQIGYDQHIYHPNGEKENHEIVFMGNNYPHAFPLSSYRAEMVAQLQERYGDRFQVFGTGWKNGVDLNFKQKKEAAVYRGCKVAINLSHFSMKQYSSDRMFRIMGSGALCLTHAYPDIEKEFANGEHLVIWNNFNELHNLIDYCLHPDHNFHAVAEQGQKLVSEKYTWDYRIQNQFLELCGILK